jgi:hypothetical protein
MCSIQRAAIGAATMGLSETVRGGMKVAKGDITGALDMGTMGMGSKVVPGGPKMPAMPELPNMSTTLPSAPPPPAATAGSQTASPFSLSMRPRRSQSLRTDRSSSVGTTGLNIPT